MPYMQHAYQTMAHHQQQQQQQHHQQQLQQLQQQQAAYFQRASPLSMAATSLVNSLQLLNQSQYMQYPARRR